MYSVICPVCEAQIKVPLPRPHVSLDHTRETVIRDHLLFGYPFPCLERDPELVDYR